MYKKIYLLSPFLLCLFLALFVPLFSPYDANLSDLNKASLAPSLSHLFGTDILGRDLLTRCAKALGVSLFVGFSTSFLALFLGLVFALLSRLFWHNFFLGLFDMLLALPSLLIAMFAQSVLGGGLYLTIIVLALGHFAFIAKLLYVELENLSKSDFYLCAIVLGSSRLKALFYQLMPAYINICFVLFILNTAHAISGEATLSFFGLGVALGEPSLGNLLSEGARALFIGAWWLILFPVLLLLCLIMPLLALGNSLQDKFSVNVK